MKKQLVGGMAAMAMVVSLGACSDDGGGDGDLEAFCRLSSESEDATDFPSPDELEEFIDVSPSEIRDDVETVADVFSGLDDAEDLEDLSAAFEEEDVVDATTRIEAFVEENC